jgi:SAM-dependent methyltransferase
VGKEGHDEHRTLLLSHTLSLLSLKPEERLLDLGCGQGILARHIPHGVHYVGIDSAASLISKAKRLTQQTIPNCPIKFLVADATKPLPLQEGDFDAACFLLSLQNMEFPDRAIQAAALALRPGGKLLLVLNHPCFRIPRQSHWGTDPATHLQYRRIDRYLSPLKIPIQTHPSRQQNSPITYSFHFPLSSYIQWLSQNECPTIAFEEWCSIKESQGRYAKRENRARREFPLFLAILATKLCPTN